MLAYDYIFLTYFTGNYFFWKSFFPQLETSQISEMHPKSLKHNTNPPSLKVKSSFFVNSSGLQVFWHHFSIYRITSGDCKVKWKKSLKLLKWNMWFIISIKYCKPPLSAWTPAVISLWIYSNRCLVGKRPLRKKTCFSRRFNWFFPETWSNKCMVEYRWY